MRLRRNLALTLAATTALSTPAVAQVAEPFRQVDENGVDLTWGDLVLSFPEGSVGSGAAKLELIRTNMTSGGNQWDEYSFHRTVSGSTATISIGFASLRAAPRVAALGALA